MPGRSAVGRGEPADAVLAELRPADVQTGVVDDHVVQPDALQGLERRLVDLPGPTLGRSPGQRSVRIAAHGEPAFAGVDDAGERALPCRLRRRRGADPLLAVADEHETADRLGCIVVEQTADGDDLRFTGLGSRDGRQARVLAGHGSVDRLSLPAPAVGGLPHSRTSGDRGGPLAVRGVRLRADGEVPVVVPGDPRQLRRAAVSACWYLLPLTVVGREPDGRAVVLGDADRHEPRRTDRQCEDVSARRGGGWSGSRGCRRGPRGCALTVHRERRRGQGHGPEECPPRRRARPAGRLLRVHGLSRRAESTLRGVGAAGRSAWSCRLSLLGGRPAVAVVPPRPAH